jgi:hypothetical protein
MVESTCVSCQHWTPPTERTEFKTTVEPVWSFEDHPDAAREMDKRQADADEKDRLFGHCEAIQMGPASAGEALPLALTLDGSGYMADLFTRAEFGCALWTPKPTARRAPSSGTRSSTG